MNDDKNIWQKIIDVLDKTLSSQSFNTWFSEISIEDVYIDKNYINVKVKNTFTANFLNKNYTKILEEIAFSLTNTKYTVNFVANTNSNKKNHSLPQKDYFSSKLNPHYSFEEFVIGKNNRFAHSASLAVAESPGTTYNPLFIYGESGMGKTHLMQAIGNYVSKELPGKRVYYITTEEFTNEMIENIRKNTMANFRNKYRNIDLLLIDDIHFLSKKEGTQEEFFHTFNALYEKKKQIVLTSDRPPKDIPDLEKRLITRFEWGLLADLKSPDFETRVAILKKKADNEGISLKNDVIEFIAEHIYSNVRALEGSLIRILAYASYNALKTENINIEMAREILTDMISDTPQDITMEKITKIVCDAFDITQAQIMDRTRKRNIAFPRQIAMYLANLLIPQKSLKEIAKFYKRKDHTTVLHAKKTIEEQFKKDNDFRISIESLIKDIKK